MKIIHTDIYRYSIKMEPFTIATGTMHFAQNVFLRIYTDQGQYGVGECSAFPMITGETQESCLVMAKIFAAIWKGKSADDIPARMQELHHYIAGNSTIKSAFDMALYDLASKAASQPLYRFLGGAPRKVETDITVGINDPQTMARQAREFVENGAGIIKVKLGKDPSKDLSLIQAVREAVGSDITLRIDANQGWSFQQATHLLSAMGDLNIEFCEQPMRSWDDHYLPELCVRSPVKIMADESVYTHHDARNIIRSNACHYINIKLAKSGGILEALKIHELAEQAGIHCMIGGMLESRLAITANLHFAYASRGVHFYDLDSALLGHLEDPVTGGMDYNGYHPTLEDLPGIGADIDQAYLNRCEHWRI